MSPQPRGYVAATIDGSERRFPIMGARFRDHGLQLRVLVQGPLSLPLAAEMAAYGEDDTLIARGNWTVGSEPRAVGARDYELVDLRLTLLFVIAK